MALLSHDDIKKLALISRLDVHDDELDEFSQHIDAVLEYASRVKDVTASVSIPRDKNVNVFREDVVKRTDPETVLAQAPDREEDFFVVPTIIDKN